VNPFTKLPHTTQYKNILEARKKLPVYAQMEEFYEIVCTHFVLQIIKLIYNLQSFSLIETKLLL
jgi:pre-mRNA-splicing factor ATP-dependent RNA helicase DHX15/PRP43